jgi:hypothetical protein
MFGTLFRSKGSEFSAIALAARLHLYGAVVKSLRSSYGSTEIAQVDPFAEELVFHTLNESRSV